MDRDVLEIALEAACAGQTASTMLEGIFNSFPPSTRDYLARELGTVLGLAFLEPQKAWVILERSAELPYHYLRGEYGDAAVEAYADALRGTALLLKKRLNSPEEDL